MSVGLAIFTGFWYFFSQAKFGYTLCSALRQPLFIAFLLGMIMGDLSTAMIIGATIELVYLGMIYPGGNIPADESLAALIAIPIALKTGMSPEMAVVLAVPCGVVGVFIDQIRRTVNATFIHKADKHALEGNTKGIWLCATLWPLLVAFALRFPPVFVANLYGPEAVQSFMNVIPQWILHGLSVAGGILPALGFAITIFVIGKKKLLPFFIIGFFLVKYLGINVMAAAIFGTCIAVLTVFMSRGKGGEVA